MQTEEYVAPEKTPLVGRSQAPPCKGILPAECSSFTTGSCAKVPKAFGREQHIFLVKQLVILQMCLHLQREALAVGERTVLCGGENPQQSDMKKESLEWQMASKSHVLNFNLFPARMLVILQVETIKLELHQLMSRTKIQQILTYSMYLYLTT